MRRNEPLTGGELTYTLDEAAAAIGVHPDTVVGMVERGVLARVPHVGRRFLIAKIEVDRFIRSAITKRVSA